MITGDEKWITYDNNVGKRSWLKPGEASQTVAKNAKPALTPRKGMLRIWWDWKGIVHHELLGPDQTINSTLYCQQLMRLKQTIQKRRPKLINRKGVVFNHDNVRPHTSLVTRQKLRKLGWEVFMHPPYSPDLAPSDSHLFRSQQNSLNGAKLASNEASENHLVQFFAQKSQKFYSDGIMILPEKWQKVIDQKQHIYHRLVFETYMNKFALKNMKKPEITFFPTQYKYYDNKNFSKLVSISSNC